MEHPFEGNIRENDSRNSSSRYIFYCIGLALLAVVTCACHHRSLTEMRYHIYNITLLEVYEYPVCQAPYITTGYHIILKHLFLSQMPLLFVNACLSAFENNYLAMNSPFCMYTCRTSAISDSITDTVRRR